MNCEYRSQPDGDAECSLVKSLSPSGKCAVSEAACLHCLKNPPLDDEPNSVVLAMLVQNNPEHKTELIEKYRHVIEVVRPVAASPPPSPSELNCVHRGAFKETILCDLCGQRGTPMQTFDCSKHGQCSFHKQHSKVQSCASCPDRDDGNGAMRAELHSLPLARLPGRPTSPRTAPEVCFITDRHKHPAVSLRDAYRGSSVILCGGGPSIRDVDLSQLRQPGIVLAAMNNVATIIRPHLWVSVDDPSTFHESIWKDPAIQKFCMAKKSGDRLKVWDAQLKQWIKTRDEARESPNTYFYSCDKSFTNETFLTQPAPAWHNDEPESKSVMLVAMRLLYWLGFRRVFLLGVDFEMDGKDRYCFDEVESKKQARHNNTKYKCLNRIFNGLSSHMLEYGYQVFNATPGSKLTAFPRCTLEQAIEDCTRQIPKELVTKGMY